MFKVIRLWAIWIFALATGIIGTSLVYRAIFNHIAVDWIYGIPVLFLGVWITGNILSAARKIHSQHR